MVSISPIVVQMLEMRFLLLGHVDDEGLEAWQKQSRILLNCCKVTRVLVRQELQDCNRCFLIQKRYRPLNELLHVSC